MTSYACAIVSDTGVNGGHSQETLKQDVRSKNDRTNFLMRK